MVGATRRRPVNLPIIHAEDGDGDAAVPVVNFSHSLPQGLATTTLYPIVPSMGTWVTALSLDDPDRLDCAWDPERIYFSMALPDLHNFPLLKRHSCSMSRFPSFQCMLQFPRRRTTTGCTTQPPTGFDPSTWVWARTNCSFLSRLQSLQMASACLILAQVPAFAADWHAILQPPLANVLLTFLIW